MIFLLKNLLAKLNVDYVLCTVPSAKSAVVENNCIAILDQSILYYCTVHTVLMLKLFGFLGKCHLATVLSKTTCKIFVDCRTVSPSLQSFVPFYE